MCIRDRLHYVHDNGAALGRAVGVLRDLDELRANPWAPPDALTTVVQKLAVRQHQVAIDAGRDVIAASAASTGRRWRRVTDGNPCAFCAMLATRTDYTSPLAAQYVVGRGKSTKIGARGRVGLGVKPRGKRQLGQRYHDRCGCTVAEVFDDWEPSYAERQRHALYNQARDACDEEGIPASPANIMRKMRELGQGVLHDAHVPDDGKHGRGAKTEAGGRGGRPTEIRGYSPRTQAGGSGGKPPKPPRALASAGAPKPKRGGREPRERTVEDFDHWQKRQDALPFETDGAVMKPHEIEFAERFIEDGYHILRWLPQGRRRPDGTIPPESDFEWRPGVVVELKRSNNLQTIKDYIRTNLKKGKTVFVADFGERKPRTSVLNGLRKFAPQLGKLEELWAYWDGNLVRLQ